MAHHRRSGSIESAVAQSTDSVWFDSPTMTATRNGRHMSPFAPASAGGGAPPGMRRDYSSTGTLLPGDSPATAVPPLPRSSKVMLSPLSTGSVDSLVPPPPPLSLSEPAPSTSLSEVQAELAKLCDGTASANQGTGARGDRIQVPLAALEELQRKLATLQNEQRQPPPPLPGLPGGSVPRNLLHQRVLVARSWEELQHFLFLDSWDDRIGKHRLRHVFRGMTRAHGHTLQTSIQRLGDLEHIRTVEPGMVRAFRKYAVPEFGANGGSMRDASVWEWLTVAQHHGLPTRMLDWTHNPLIAAHFVTDRPEDLCVDGAIWCVDPSELNARCEEFRRWNLARPQGAKVIGLFTIEQLEEYCHDCAPAHARPGSRISSLEMFDATQLRCAFLEPPSIDARLVHQQGLFSALSLDVDMEALLTSHPRCARKIIVPAWLKREVRDKLDAVGVSERTLFPGLDGLCTWLRRYYTKGDGRPYAAGEPPPRARLGSRQADAPPSWPDANAEAKD